MVKLPAVDPGVDSVVTTVLSHVYARQRMNKRRAENISPEAIAVGRIT
jgi:hypothetical protein